MDDLLLKYSDGQIMILTPGGYREPLPGEILPLRGGGYISLEGEGRPKGMPLWLDLSAVAAGIAALLVLGNGILWSAPATAKAPLERVEMRLPAAGS